MKILNFLYLFAILFAGVLFSSCSSDDDATGKSDEIPDTYFEIEVSGAETNNFELTIPSGEPQTDFTIIGSYSPIQDLLLLNFRQIPTGWGLSIGVTAGSLTTGNYESTGSGGAISTYNNTGSNPFTFFSTDFNVEITKADQFANAMGVSIHYLDGTFSGTLQDPNDSNRVVNVTGSFSGVAVGSN